MDMRSLHDGREDGLEPLESLSLDGVTSFRDLLRAMSKTAFSGRQLGEAYDVLSQMIGDPSCTAVLTISGAMTVAKQGRIICDMIDRGLVHAVIATGALIAHGLTESIGLTHYRHDPAQSDEALFERGYNRIYDTLEMESNLNEVAQLVAAVLEKTEPEGGVWSSARLCRAWANGSASWPRGRACCEAPLKRAFPSSFRPSPTARWAWTFRPGPCTGHWSKKESTGRQPTITPSCRQFLRSIRSSTCRNTPG